MADSFDTVVLIHKMQENFPDEDLFIEKSNGKRIVIHPKEKVLGVEGYILICKPQRHIAIECNHIISIINKGDL